MRFDKALNLLMDNKEVGIIYRRTDVTTYVINTEGRLNAISKEGDLVEPVIDEEAFRADDWAFGVTID